MAEGSAPPNARRRSLPLAADVPDDCTSCGVCCQSGSATYIAVFAADERRMDDGARSLTTMIGDRRYMQFEAGRCVALRSRDGRHTCAIYAMRPDACRWLERASSTCREMILQHAADAVAEPAP